jgi:SAM-dependent methyltransferase
MMSDIEIKRQVSEFYDQVGWHEVGQGIFQNARYEDLRPVSREYIHRCHLRVTRHLRPTGKYLLDAGCGPIQYPEYLEYSRDYQFRVCADISIVALQEARKRIGEYGLFVVADIANLPFKPGVFYGVVSLHTIHHLPVEEHVRAYEELYRLLAPECTGVIVNGWVSAPLASLADGLVRLARKLKVGNLKVERSEMNLQPQASNMQPKGTFIRKHNAAWLKREVGSRMPVEIWVWRSVNVHFLRTFIHPRLGGRWLLRLLYWLEERFPHFLGKNGQYPLIVIRRK